MRALSSTDLRAALDALASVCECATSEREFACHGLAGLRRLVPADLATLSICNLDTGHRDTVSDVPNAITKEQGEVFDHHLREHPLVRAHGRNPAAATHRISDVVCANEFRRTPLYNDYYRPIRLEYAMAVPVHVRQHELVSFVLNRSGRDFSDRDRACVETIRPHLGNLYRTCRRLEGSRVSWGAPAAPLAAQSALTEREREVMRWIAGGKTDKDIGGILGISHRTVNKHLQRTFEKLGVETRTAALARWMGVRDLPQISVASFTP